MGLLNVPRLALPDAEETIAFRAIEKILALDPTLKRVLRHFHAWRGETDDLLQPTPSTCPHLGIAPRPQASRWEAEGMHSMPFSISLQLAVNGSNVDQLMNLWGAVRRALWPRDAAQMAEVRALVLNAAITKPTMTLGGFGVQVQDKGARVLIAQGSLNVLLLISTP
jgi:hypothetical protein